MASHAAIADNFLSVTEDQTVESVLKALKKNKTLTAVVVDPKGKLTGIFSYEILLTNLLPINIGIAGGSFTMDAAPGVAKRLRKVKPLPVKDLMYTKPEVIYPETPTWEGLNRSLKSKHPIVVIDRASQKPLGLITEQSLYEEFERMQD